jgi:hypothetical protein
LAHAPGIFEVDRRIEFGGGEEDRDRALEAKRGEVAKQRRPKVLHRRVGEEGAARLHREKRRELLAAEGVAGECAERAEIALATVDRQDVQPVLTLERAVRVRLHQQLGQLPEDDERDGNRWRGVRDEEDMQEVGARAVGLLSAVGLNACKDQ